MTKCIVIGEKSPEVSKKKIEFISLIKLKSGGKGGLVVGKNPYTKPEKWDNLELISKNYRGFGIDLIFAYDKDIRSIGSCLYLGHWNDGIV